MRKHPRRDWSAVDAAIFNVIARARVPLASAAIFARAAKAGVTRLHFDIRLQALKRRGWIEIASGRTSGSKWQVRRP